MSIPKIIHYCWFGGAELPKKALKCIESWKKFCPDFEIRRWDESNYDVHKNKYMSQAYDSKKWAFVSDFARLDIIATYGGIYFDVDVEVVKPIYDLLAHKCFLPRQTLGNIATGLGFGAEKGNPAVLKMLAEYESISFYLSDGSYDLTPCPARNTAPFLECGLDIKSNEIQFIDENTAVVYPEEFFCPINAISRELKITDNTYTIHHFDASWQTKDFKIKKRIRSIIGPKATILIINIKRKLTGK